MANEDMKKNKDGRDYSSTDENQQREIAGKGEKSSHEKESEKSQSDSARTGGQSSDDQGNLHSPSHEGT